MCRTFRLAAYRQFTWWTHNRLGHRVRRVIPSCVVMAIRRKFPDVEGHYVGFREVNDDDDMQVYALMATAKHDYNTEHETVFLHNVNNSLLKLSFMFAEKNHRQ